MRDPRKVLSCLFGGVVLALSGSLLLPASASGDQESPKPVRIGVLAKRGPERCLEKWGPTAEYLTSEIPGHSFTIVPLGFEEINPAVERGEVDFILTNPSLYVGLEKLYDASRIATLKNRRLDGVYTVYGGVIFRRADREDIQDLDDLKGKTFMATNENSFGGWQAAWRELKDRGIDPHRDFRDLTFGGTHDAVVYAVRDGKVDAGSVRNDTLERMAQEGKIRLEEFRVSRDERRDTADRPFLCSTRLYPEWPLAKAKHTSDEVAEEVAVALLKMSPDTPAAQAARCAGWTVPLNYQPIHDCLKELRIGPYKDYGKVTLRDVLRQYWPWMVGTVVAAVLIVLFAVYVVHLNRRLREAVAEQRNELVERKRAEDALWESEERYRGVVEDTPVLICRFLPGGEITYVNQAYCKYFAKTPEELVDSSLLSLIPEADRETVMANISALTVKSPTQSHEHPVIAPGGEIRWQRWTNRALFDDGGKAIAYQSIGNDITERKRVEEALWVERDKLESVFVAMIDGVYVVNQEYDIESVNPVFTAAFGPYEGRKCYAYFHDRDDVCPWCKNPDVFAGKTVQWEWTSPKNGKTYDLLDTPLRNADGSISKLAIFRDSTERKRVEEELRESEERHRSLTDDVLDSSAVGIFILDAAFRVVWVNQALECYFGLRRDEVVGKDKRRLIRERIKNNFEDPGTFIETVFATYDDNTYVENFECHVLPDDGREERWLEHRSQPIESGLYAGGRIEHYYDITERKRAEENQAALQEQLHHAQKMEAIGQLAGGVAHDFSNLLTVITGYSALARTTLSKDHQAIKLLEGVEEAAEQAGGVTRSLLTFSHKMAVEKKPVELRSLLESSLHLLRRVLPAGIEVVKDMSDEPPVWASADGTQFQQVVLNLAINARDAMPDGGALRISVSRSPTDENAPVASAGSETLALDATCQGPVARLLVSDSGMGMSPEVQERIFEPFFTTKPRGQGTGLGLAIIHSIVKDHGGRIEVQSEPGQGTTFTVVLPALEEAAIPDTVEPPPPLSSGQGELILLAEDNWHVRSVIASSLESLGYKILEAADGTALMQCFERHRARIRLLVIDVDRAQRNGLDCLRDIRVSGARMPAVIISTTVDADLDSELDEDTFLLRKPFQVSDLGRLAGRLLGARRKMEHHA